MSDITARYLLVATLIFSLASLLLVVWQGFRRPASKENHMPNESNDIATQVTMFNELLLLLLQHDIELDSVLYPNLSSLLQGIMKQPEYFDMWLNKELQALAQAGGYGATEIVSVRWFLRQTSANQVGQSQSQWELLRADLRASQTITPKVKTILTAALKMTRKSQALSSG